ncbi:MAG: LytTR family DNA-binding domain-containing protein [Bacteroidota bacterium]
MKALIIEDEYPAADRLQSLIHKADPQVEVLAVLDSIKGALEWFEEHAAPDLIFSDIQLSDGLSFEIYEKIQIKSPIIFTTAYDEYAIKAFKVKSIDYLLKPIKLTELSAAIEKLKEMLPRQEENGMSKDLKEVMSLLGVSNKTKYKDRFLVKGKDVFIPITIQEIAYFTTAHENVYIVKTDGKRHPLDVKLETLEEALNPAYFFRLNRQFITHIQAINSIHPYFNGRLTVELNHCEDDSIIVSRDKAKVFRAWMGEGV